MYQFPFPLKASEYAGKLHIGYVNPQGHFVYDVDDPYSWVPPELTRTDAEYLNGLNEMLRDASRAVISSLVSSVLAPLDPKPRNNGYFNDSGALDNPDVKGAVEKVAATLILAEVAHQAESAKDQVLELTDRYNACLDMPATEYAELTKVYGALPAAELRILVENLLDRIDQRLPDYSIALLKLKWNHRFLDQLEKDNKMLHFYGMLREVSASRIN